MNEVNNNIVRGLINFLLINTLQMVINIIYNINIYNPNGSKYISNIITIYIIYLFNLLI